MNDYLSAKIIRETKTASGSKKYTVQQLRKEVRALVKEANTILYQLDESKRAGYMRQIASDIQLGKIRESKKDAGYFSQMNVKYMKSKQLKTAYNALTAFISADKESLSAVRKKAKRMEEMRIKAGETLSKNITPKAYEKMMEMWTKYENEVDMFGYRELIDYSISSSRKKESIHDALQRGEDKLKSMGVTPTPKKVLKYLGNERAVEAKMAELIAQGMSENKAYDETIKYLNKQ